MSDIRKRILNRVRLKVRRSFEDSSNWVHDFDHVRRVVINGRKIARSEGIDPFLVELACLLHDLGRKKEQKMGLNWGVSRHAEYSYQMGQSFLQPFVKEIGKKNMEKVLEAVLEHSRPVLANPKNKISQVLQDADRGVSFTWYGIISVLAFNKVIRVDKPSSEKQAKEIFKNHWPKILKDSKKRQQAIHWLEYLSGWYKGRKKTRNNPYVAALHFQTSKKIYKRGFERLQKWIKRLKKE